MKASDIIEALKTFFLDILGYFAPGFFAILVLTACVFPQFFFYSELIKIDPTWRGFVIVFMSYVLGYVIYSIPIITDPIFKIVGYIKIKQKRKWESLIPDLELVNSEFNKLKETQVCKDIVHKTWKLNSTTVYSQEEIEKMNFNTIRNIAMSYAPESDTKVYTFMFRADLCQHISTFSIFISVIGFVCYLLDLFFKVTFFFKTDICSMVIYLLLFISSILLYRTRIRFYKIAMLIPLSIFLSKFFKLEEKGHV